jgi:hypothetical protein
MKTKILLIILVLLSNQIIVFSQTQKKKESSRSVSLRTVPIKANKDTSLLKLKNVILVDFKNPPNDWVYVFHLKDNKSKFEVGKDLTKSTTGFLICTDETIGDVLLEQKDQWINQKVNVYLRGRDMGLTPYMNVGFVIKIELLDSKGKVVKIIQ